MASLKDGLKNWVEQKQYSYTTENLPAVRRKIENKLQRVLDELVVLEKSENIQAHLSSESNEQRTAQELLKQLRYSQDAIKQQLLLLDHVIYLVHQWVLERVWQ